VEVGWIEKTHINAGTLVYVRERDLKFGYGRWSTAYLLVCLDYVKGEMFQVNDTQDRLDRKMRLYIQTHSLHRRIERTCRTGWRMCAGRPRGLSSPPRHDGRIFVFSAHSRLVTLVLHTSSLSRKMSVSGNVYVQSGQRGPRMLARG
jgi:hypothetical protein